MNQSAVQMKVLLTEALTSYSEYTFPLDELQLEASLQDGVVNATYRAYLLDGSLNGQTRADIAHLSEVDSLVATWNVKDVEIQETLRTLQPDQLPKYAGRLSTSGQATASLDVDRLAETLSGDGQLTVRDGRLVLLPVISGLVKAVGSQRQPTVDGGRRFRDEAEITFELTPDAVEAKEIVIVSPLVAARGDGEIYFDGRLDLRMNAGPLERIQEGLGAIGKIFGSISDRLVTYHVTGAVEDPKIGVKPLGLGAQKGRKERDAAREDAERGDVTDESVRAPGNAGESAPGEEPAPSSRDWDGRDG